MTELALLFALGIVARAMPAPILPALLGLLLIASTRLQAPRALRRRYELALGLAAVVGGALLAPLSPSNDGDAHGLGLGAMILAVARRLYPRPSLGDAGTLALGLVAVAAFGRSQPGHLFVALGLAYLALAMLAIRRADEARAPLDARRIAGSVATAALAGLVALGLGRALPPLHARVLEGALGLDVAPPVTMSGFSDRMRLGSLSSALENDEVVLRIYGERVDYLRGIVFDTYVDGRWTRANGRATDARSAPFEGAPKTRIQPARASVDPFLVPLRAGGVRTEDGDAELDGIGLWRPAVGRRSGEVWIDPAMVGEAPDAPDDDDRALPESIRGTITELATAWAKGSTGAADRLSAIEARLGKDYAYSLRYERTPGEDPVVDFLTKNKQGHCEYFASAMTLMARALGVPARVVGGFRAHEVSELGGHVLVRGRDAHAWVEAYLPGRGWTSFDPTPQARGEAPSRGRLEPVSELLRAWLAELRAHPRRPALAALALATSALLARAWRRRRRAPRPAPPAARTSASGARLLAKIERELGLVKAPSEPLESFAERLRAEGASAYAELVARHAALLYGGVGDAAALEGDVARATPATRDRA